MLRCASQNADDSCGNAGWSRCGTTRQRPACRLLRAMRTMCRGCASIQSCPSSSQGRRMALCASGTAPPTAWRTRSTMAWNGCGRLATCGAPTGTFCFHFWITLHIQMMKIPRISDARKHNYGKQCWDSDGAPPRLRTGMGGQRRPLPHDGVHTGSAWNAGQWPCQQQQGRASIACQSYAQ